MSQSSAQAGGAPVAAPVRGAPRWGAPRCGYYSSVFMLWVGARFLWLGYLFVWLAAGWFFVWMPRARRASMAYLDRIHGAARRGWLRRVWQTYRHMVEFGFLLLDRAVMLAEENHGFAVTCDGLEHLAGAAVTAPGRNPEGIVLLTAHFGISEIAMPYLRRMGIDRPVHIVMYQDAREGSERFHMRHRRLLSDMTIISTTDALAAGVRIIAALKQGAIVGMRADRTLGGKGIPVMLLGEKVVLPSGPFMAAVLSGAPVLQVYTCRVGYRRYVCQFSPVQRVGDETGGTREERLARAAQNFAQGLEGVLRRFPYQWSNFYDLWTVQAAPEGRV